MIIKSFVVGPIGVNCYVVSDADSGQGIIIDPGGNAEEILAYVRAEKIAVQAIINTHGHGDHIGANDAVRKATGAPLLLHAADQYMLTDARANLSAFMGYQALSGPPDRLLAEGDEIAFEGGSFRVVHTPGHSPGGICLIGEGVVFSGDTLFAESIGRGDFPGGSEIELVRSVREKLLPLPDETRVYPGHGPETTIGWERRYNPYLQG
jgi:hydroxyacylglutathione hydrolase